MFSDLSVPNRRQQNWNRDLLMNTIRKGVNLEEYIMSMIAGVMGPTWGPSGADKTQVGSVLAPWTLLSGVIKVRDMEHGNRKQ